MRRRREVQDAPHRVLHLPFRGRAVEGDRALHFRGRERHDRNVALLGGQADDAARVRHQERGAREFVLRVEIFEDEHVGRVLDQKVVDAVVDDAQPCLEHELSRSVDDAGGEHHQARRRPLENPVARGDEPGIDAERPARDGVARQRRWPR